MKREFVFNIILLIAINLIIKPFYLFGVEARIQNLVGTEDYGLYFDYFNFVFLFQFLNDPGIQSWNAQFVPKVRSNIGIHFPKIVMIKMILAFLFSIATVLVSLLFNYERTDLIFLISTNLILSAFFMYLRGTLAGLGYYRNDSLISSVDKVMMILILGYLAWVSSYQTHFRIEALVYGQMVSYAIACIIALILVWNKIPHKEWSISWIYVQEKLKSFVPYTLVIFLVAGYSRLDGVMLGRMLDDNSYQAGLYATAFRFYDAAGMLSYLFAALLLPMFATSLQNAKVLGELIQTGLRFMIVCAVLIVCSLSFYSLEFMTLLYDDANQAFADVLILLMTGYFMVAVGYIFGTLLVAGDRIRNMNYIYASGLVLNFTLNYFLIPEYLAIGAGIATLATQILIMSGQIFFVFKYFKVIIPVKILMQSGFYLFLSTGVFYLIKSSFDTSWLSQLALSVLISLFLAFLLKVVELHEVFKWKGMVKA